MFHRIINTPLRAEANLEPRWTSRISFFAKLVRDYSLNTHTKISEKLTFFIPWKAPVRNSNVTNRSHRTKINTTLNLLKELKQRDLKVLFVDLFCLKSIFSLIFFTFLNAQKYVFLLIIRLVMHAIEKLDLSLTDWKLTDF